MAVFTKSVITDKGKELIAEAVAGRTSITLTKIETSDFIYGDVTDLTKLININTVKQTVQVSEVNRNREKVTVVAVLTNERIRTGYKINSIGIYARGNNGNEILFAVLKTNDGDMIAPKSGNVATTVMLDFVFTISESANISVTLDTSALVTTGMLESYVKKSWGFLGQPANNLNVVLTDKTNVWGAQVYRAYTPRGEFKGELRFDNNNLYTNYVNTNDDTRKSLKRVITENDVYLDDFNSNKRLIQSNLATGVTYVSKELSFYGKNEREEYFALENRIGVDTEGDGTFRVRQNNKWSPLITGDDLATDTKAGLVSLDKIREVAPRPDLSPYLKHNRSFIYKGENVLTGTDYFIRCNENEVFIPSKIKMFSEDNVEKHVGGIKIENNRIFYQAKNRNNFRWTEIPDILDFQNLENNTVKNIRLASYVENTINSSKERTGYVLTNVTRQHGQAQDHIRIMYRALQMNINGNWVNVPFA